MLVEPYCHLSYDDIEIMDLGAHFNSTKIRMGSWHVCAVSDNHLLKCFGRNDFGQLGVLDVFWLMFDLPSCFS